MTFLASEALKMSRTNAKRLTNSKLRLACILSSVLFLGTMGLARLTYGQQGANRAQDAAANAPKQAQASQFYLLPVQGNVSMLVGAGANITVQAGDDGIILVDVGTEEMSDKVLEAIRPLSRKPLAYIINTNERLDHIGGNANVRRGGRPLANSAGVGQFRADRSTAGSAYVIGVATMLDRMSEPKGKGTALPEEMWPNDTFSEPQKKLYFNGEGVEILRQPATTDADSIVFFRRSDVISAGDIFDPTEYPFIDLERGGSIQGVIEGLNRLKMMAIPADRRNGQMGGTLIVPGHGRLSDMGDLASYQQMVTIVRDRIQDMIKDGKSLEQVKAAKPTRDYDPLYGHTTGNWTTDMFVEATYKSLTAKSLTAK